MEPIMPGKKKSADKELKSRLQQELIGLVPEIEEEGLVFLLKQANTIIHNQRASSLNKDINEINRKKSGKPGPAASAVPGTGSGGFEIEIDRSDNGKTYYFTVNGRKHFMDIEETRKIAQLCYRPETKSKALEFLYQYFLNERDEVLLEHKIKSKTSPFFEELFRAVRANFSL